MFKTYSFSDAKRDSARALEEYKNRWWAKFEANTKKMHKEKLKISGIIIHCLIASAAVLLVSTSFS